jgi:chromosome partitioning protein
MSKVTPIGRRGRETPLGAVIAVGNQKGGVGKSTNTVHLAAALGEKGYRCLVLDLDPTAGSTKLLGVRTEEFAGTFELLTGEDTVEALALDHGMPAGVHLVPARIQLAALESELNRNRFSEKTKILAEPLKAARRVYDFIFLDTPPSPGDITTVAAYASADWFLLSVFPQPLAIGGLCDAINDIALVRTTSNRALEVLGVIICAVKRNSSLWLEIEEVIKAHFPGRGFRTSISQSVVLERISGQGKTLFQDRRLAKHKCAEEYRSLAGEIEQRVLNREKFIASKPHRGERAANRVNA